MSERLIEAIRTMRVGVLSRLAEECSLYVDRDHVRRCVAVLSDAAIWDEIEAANSGLLGYVRRLQMRLRKRVETIW
jgi:hypothetical protein